MINLCAPSRGLSASAFAIPITVIALLSAIRSGGLFGVGAATSDACAALSALEPLSPAYLERLESLSGGMSLNHSGALNANAFALSLAVSFADGEPEEPDLWDSLASTTLTSTIAFASKISKYIDVYVSRPSRVAFAVVADYGVMLPVTTDDGRAAFLAPAWALPAALSLNDWPLRRGTKGSPIAYPVDSLFSSLMSQIGDFNAVASALPFAARLSPASVIGEDSILNSEPGICECSTFPSSIFSGAGSGPDSVDADGSLGRSLESLGRAALHYLINGRYPDAHGSHDWPCAPELRVLCTCTGGTSEYLKPVTRWCLTLNGPQTLHVVHFAPPRAISPLFFEAHDSVEAESSSHRPHYTRLSLFRSSAYNVLRARGGVTASVEAWGDIHVVNSLRTPALNDSMPVDSASLSSLRSAIGLSRTPEVSLSHDEELSLLRFWLPAHFERSREDLTFGLCDPARENRPPYVPSHVVAAATESLSLLKLAHSLLGASNPDNATDIESVANRALHALRLARFHAASVVSDPYVSTDSYVPISHQLAIYAPWWAPLILPVLLSLVQAYYSFNR